MTCKGYTWSRPVHEPQKKGHVAQSSENEPWAGRVENSGAENSNSPVFPEHKDLKCR